MIQVENLTKFYGDLPAIQDVSFAVQQGEILGFLGPNGAGKTTIMRILTGYMPPSSGRASVAGFDLFQQSLEARRHVGYMPEAVPLYPEMRVRAYLSFVAQLRRVAEPAACIDGVMARTGLTDRAESIIGTLSKGYRQRVGLAQALVHDPDVLVLDEPTIGLDPKQIIEVRELIRGLGGRRTVILSTHILPEVSQVCSRVLIIHRGRIVAEDTPERLTARLRGVEQVSLRLEGPNADALATLAAMEGMRHVEPAGDGRYELAFEPGYDLRADVAEAVVRAGWRLLELSPHDVSLEKVFLNFTTE